MEEGEALTPTVVWETLWDEMEAREHYPVDAGDLIAKHGLNIQALAYCEDCAAPFRPDSPMDYTVLQGWAYVTAEGLRGGEALHHDCRGEPPTKRWAVTIRARRVTVEEVEQTVHVEARDENDAREEAFSQCDPDQWETLWGEVDEEDLEIVQVEEER